MISKGLEGIVANTTRLSDVLGDKGQLIYAGYDINELAGKVSFEEVIYLLWNERLPNRAELDGLSTQLRAHRELPAQVVEFLKAAPKPLHGGANEGVIVMLKEIGDEDKVDAWVEEQFAQKKKIMGMGHRVYKTLDPRAPHLRDMAVKLTEQLGEPKWVRMSERIAALVKEKKNLNANVDFYSATVYYSLGLPTDLFTPIFAISRTAGWTAHILEQLSDNRLYRPLSEYTGTPVGLTVKPIDER